MALDLFVSLKKMTRASFTDLKDIRSEFYSTMACCEEGNCCAADE